jgi:hypothetical protein
MRVRLSSFENFWATSPEVVDLEWPEFVASCVHEFVPPGTDKKTLPLLSPAEFNGPRLKANVTRVHACFLDFDGPDPKTGLSDAATERVFEIAAPYTWVAYTSFSHASKPNRFRLVLPVSRPVAASEWPRFIQAVFAMFEGLPDTQCADASRMYGEPYAPEGTDAWVLDNTGAALDVDGLLATAPAPTAPTAPVPAADGVLTIDHLTALQRRFRQSTKPHKITVAKALPKLRDGLAFADPGQRDDTILRVVTEIVRAYPECSDASIAAVFEPSIALMLAQDPSGPDMDVVRDKVARCRENRGRFVEARDAQRVTEKVAVQLTHLGRPAYTAEDVATWAGEIGPDVTPEQFQKHWIYQLGSTYYFRYGDSIIGPKVKPEMTKNATVFLAPAHTVGVDAYTVTNQGNLVPKSPEQLVEDYGTPLAYVEASLIAQTTHYDHARGVLVDAVRPRRALTPAYSPEVDGWLCALGGVDYDLLSMWLALAPDLRYPLPAIYLDGLKNGGKSLFAQSLSRLWTTTQCTTAESLARAFNSAITECPVVFADEFLPPELQGARGTGRLREIIASRSRTLTRKYIPDAPLDGCIRLIMAANNPNLLGSEEHLTENDIAAIAERFLYVYVTQASVDYLAALPDGGASFRDGDVFAKHVLYLAERAPERDGRFGIRPRPSRLHRSLTVGSGARSTVCNWLVGALLNRGSLVSRPKLAQGVRVRDGALYVVPSVMSEHWDAVKTHTRAPAAHRIGSAVHALSDGERTIDGVTYRRIRTDLLLQWCTESAYADPGTVQRALAE